MKYFLIFISFFVYTLWVNATTCDFWGYDIKEKNVYWITFCDNEYSDIIHFADYSSFIIDDTNKNLASDANYNYNQNYVISQVNWSEFIEINKYIFTDRKNIFIKSQDLYLYVSKYKFDTEILTIYETGNWWRYLLKVNWNIFNINISWWYVSYNRWIHKIVNIKDLDNFEKITPFIYNDGINFYSTFLNNQSTQWVNFGIKIATADFFSSNKKQFFQINEMWKELTKNNYTEENKEKLKLIYNKLQLTKNPYTNEDEYNEYGEFFIKKELLLYYLWIIINN
jgi:hypothetical protein